MISNSYSDIEPVGALPNARQMEWYERERSIFFHFGMNTFTGREWGDGTEDPALFNPTECSVDSWVKAISDGGFKCAILTAKHHDGFCLWQTKYTEHSIKNSPYKNGKGDIVREFTDACRKYGVKAGIYLSPWDRHERSWGTDEYNDFYANQLTELMTGYGKIWECWWDGAGSTEASYDWERWAKIVHENQPDAVIFGSLGATPWVDVRWVGNEKGIAGEPCYATIDENSLVVECLDELNHGKIGGNRFIPAEADVSIRPGWFYHEDQDSLVRTPSNLMELYFQSVGRGAGLLLNIPPNKKGLLAAEDVNSISEFNKRLSSLFENDLSIGADIEVENLQSGVQKIRVALPQKREINAILLGEAIELGQRITEIRVSALSEGDKIELATAKSVGYKRILHFENISTDLIEIEASKSVDTPVLSKLGLYHLSFEKDEATRRKRIPTHTKIDGGVAEIDLGGIFTFDTIIGENIGEHDYCVYLFNGTSYDLVKKGKSRGFFRCRLDTPSDGAYRLKIVFENDIPSDAVFEVE